MDEWFVVIDGKPAGPYTFEQIRSLGIVPGTFVKTAAMDDYKEAHEIAELRELFGFKRRITLPQYFATLDIRLLAVALDYFIITIVYAFLAVIAVAFVSGQFLRLAISASGLVLIPLSKMIYAIIMEASPRQATYGKFWLGLKVCDERGMAISFGQSLVRNLAKILSMATLGIGYVSGFFNKKQQCLHDTIAGTLVVKGRLL
ncbi:MAG: hypothetical protein K0S09_636 [Sphingobacteriaceae bacterium]|jgi:uncharacterized RDD family membrane protein YckC|nr:hypothetical protein [Sphingobacteriaceae bacterium]